MSEKDEKKIFKKDGEVTGLLDFFVEKPIWAFVFVFCAMYLFWYFRGGPEKVELRTAMEGWPIVFKYLLGF